MIRRFRLVLPCLAAGLLIVAPAEAKWEAVGGELGRNPARITLFAGAGWTGVWGSDVKKTEPAPTLEVGVTLRALGSLSLYGSYALSQHDIKGQLVQVLGQPVRPDNFSGTVDGTYEPTRIRAGLRLDGLYEEKYRVHPYLAGGVVFSLLTVKINSVDGEPPLPSLSPDNEPVDISEFEQEKLGAFLRGGVDVRLVGPFSLYLDGIYEVIEFPPGLSALASANAGLTLRPF
jgi:hypothetical protein